MSRTALLPLIALALTATASAQQAQRTGALAPGGTGLIAGRVADPDSGKPVREAVVWLQVDALMRPENPRVMTDADGRFVFVNVPAGRYRLIAEKPGYLRGLYGQKALLGDGGELELSDGQLATDVQLPIWKHATIGGTVTDEAGEPVVGVSVRAFRKVITFGEVRFTPSFVGTVGTTDDRGVYRLSSLAPGEYVVAVPSTLTTFPADIMPRLLGSELISDASRAISEISVIGSPTNQQIGGSVILTGNRAIVPPAPGDDVTAVYRTTLFPAATRLGDATSIVLKAGDERSGVDILLRPVRTGRVSGRIAGPEGAVGPAAIRLIPAGEALLSVGTGFDAATGLTDAEGRFTLLGVPEGQYVAWVEKRLPGAAGQPPEMRPLLFGQESVTVGPAGTADVTIALRHAPRINVRLDVRKNSGLKSEVFEVVVEAVGVGTRAILYPNAQGMAALLATPGRYVFTPFSAGTPCTAVLHGDRDVSDDPLVLEGDDVEVTVVCGEPPTQLSGTVRDERGSLDAEAIAVAFPSDKRFWTGAELRARRKASAFTSAGGSFSMANLPPGEYLIAALPAATAGFWQDPALLDKLTPAATRVTLGPGESRTVDIRTVRLR